MSGHGSSPAEAALHLARVYGVRGSATPLVGELDENFLVEEADGARSVLKIAHPDAERAGVELQIAALEHVAVRDPALPVPRVRRALDGSACATVQDRRGHSRLVWRLSWLTGRPLATLRPRGGPLLREIGRSLGRLQRALQSFDHPAAARAHRWDLAQAGWVARELDVIAEPAPRALVQRAAELYAREVAPELETLPRTVIHGDANDHNVLVEEGPEPRSVRGLLDFGDIVLSRRVCEPAVAAAYALFGEPDPVGSVAELVAGFDEVVPLSDAELRVLLPLVRMRLAVSVVTSAHRKRERPDDAYVTVSEAPAWAALRALALVHPRLGEARLREACGRAPLARGPAIETWLEAPERAYAPVLGRVIPDRERVRLDLGVGSPMLGADPAHLETGPCTDLIERAMAEAGAEVGLGLYDEARAIYLGSAFSDGDHPTDEHRTVHIGLDLFAPAGTPVHAPLAGSVASVGENPAPKDYGPVLLLEHRTDGGERFWTLYGHLDASSLEGLAAGRTVKAGERIARIGAPPRNGDWPPHLHLQLVLDPLDRGHDVPGVAPARERAVWTALSPDPSRLAGLEPGEGRVRTPPLEETLSRRRQRLGAGLSLSYRRPLRLVRGWRQFVYDDEGRAYLDLYNNVPHVGHGHPRVVRAVREQLALLNTNTRYLHELRIRYADRLQATLPDPLEVVYLLNSASEANELAIRLARAHTGRRDVLVLAGGYHGHTTTLVDVSAYKFDGPGGRGRAPWVHVAPLPDGYRGSHRGGDAETGAHYADDVGAVLERMAAEGREPAAFLAETLPSVGGQIVPPPGFLPGAYERVRAAGGVCVADEVQTGFGRLGEAFWGFDLLGAVPDIVVLGKPIGNGFPLAAVVTTPAIAASFDTGMEFFSTFGGNPVACAAGLAVLDVLEHEGLQANAVAVGGRLLEGLRASAARHPLMGEVRGRGLFVGVELVRDPETLEPADREADYLVNRLRESGVLAGTDGPLHNVLKLRGPLVVEACDVDRFLEVYDDVMGESALAP